MLEKLLLYPSLIAALSSNKLMEFVDVFTMLLLGTERLSIAP
jgi:hypothetical protein